MGSHGGLGGWQSHPFALVPSGWSEAKGPIVGVEAMHEALRGWLTEAGMELKPDAIRDAKAYLAAFPSDFASDEIKALLKTLE